MISQSIRNHQESLVIEAIAAIAPRYPAIAQSEALLEDVACVALNALNPRYIRHEVDLHFFTSNAEREANLRAVQKAVEAAFEYIRRNEYMRERQQQGG